ncbi:rhamnan synthesis F family protein [Lapidilactobacillus concavus]|nr:rhamnan synthesis F family protein [Lapidilactobacillus concavus]
MQNKDTRILVVLHLFYPESWSEIKEYLRNLNAYNWDLIITYPQEKKSSLPIDEIKSFKKNVSFCPNENRGYDIGPFIMAIKTIDLTKYDVVFKLQSKGVSRKRIYIYHQLFFCRDWFKNLYQGILGAHEVHQTVTAIMQSNHHKLVSADNLFVHDPIYKENMTIRQLNHLGLVMPKNYKFVAGTCFAVDAAYLKKVQRLDVALSDFKTVPSTRGLSLAHVLERYISAVSDTSFYGNKVYRLNRALKAPLRLLYRKLSAERLLDKYDINDEYMFSGLDNRLVLSKEKKVRIGDLGVISSITKQYESIDETAPYKYLQGNKKTYDDYCAYHIKHNLPVMSVERFESLIKSIKQNGYDMKKIIIVQDDNIIYDGQHRSTILAFLNGLDYQIPVLEVVIISRRQILKQVLKLILPRSVFEKLLKKRYGRETRMSNGK